MAKTHAPVLIVITLENKKGCERSPQWLKTINAFHLMGLFRLKTRVLRKATTLLKKYTLTFSKDIKKIQLKIIRTITFHSLNPQVLQTFLKKKMGNFCIPSSGIVRAIVIKTSWY